jgi:hypothetical protein
MQFYLFSDKWVLLGDSVFHPTYIVLQYFALITAELTRHGFTPMIVAQRKGRETKRWDGKFGTTLR